MSRRADREGVPRIRYADWPSGWRGTIARSLANKWGVAVFRRLRMYGAAHDYLADLRTFRISKQVVSVGDFA